MENERDIRVIGFIVLPRGQYSNKIIFDCFRCVIIFWALKLMKHKEFLTF